MQVRRFRSSTEMCIRDSGRRGLDVFSVAFIIEEKGFLPIGFGRKGGRMYDYKKSGRRIAELRKMRGYTQETFAEKISLSWRSVADIERGYRGTSVDILMDMADVLGTSVDYLLFGESRTRGENGTEFSDVEERIEGLQMCIRDSMYPVRGMLHHPE